MRLIRVWLCSLVFAGTSLAQSLEAQVHELKLSNGMTWLVVERPGAPVFTGFVRAARETSEAHTSSGSGVWRASPRAGNRTMNEAPRALPSLSAVSVPPWSSTRWRAIESPRPSPPWARVMP